MINIYFSPKDNPSNKYIGIMQSLIKELGIVLVYRLSIKNLFQLKYAHLNWFENLYGGGFMLFFKKILVLFSFKMFRVKIVWVLHNKKGHDSIGLENTLETLLIRLLIYISYRIIIHSKDSSLIINSYTERQFIRNKIQYIPHPNYIGEYGDLMPERLKDGKVNFLFLGLIRPYKNIELLIEAFKVVFADNKNIWLNIIGYCYDIQYETKIKSLVRSNSNIKTDFRFVEDGKLTSIISLSDVIVLPYDINSSLNSGSAILAFSCKKTVICPLIGTINELQGGKVNTFFYTYKSEQEHLTALSKCISEASKSKNLKDRGLKLFEFVEEHNSKDKIKNELSEIYK